MGCQTTYSCPIEIPTGAIGQTGNDGSNGLDGANGANGTDGILILENTVASPYTSLGLGGETMATYTIDANKLEAKDELILEALFTYPSTITAGLSITLGGVDLVSVSFDNSTGDTAVIPPGGVASEVTTRLKATILVSSTSVQKYFTETIYHNIDTQTISSKLKALGLSTTSTIDASVKCTVDGITGSVICDYFTVKLSKYTP